MALNLNKFPYFDDIDNARRAGYHRVLFKPGYAVQARELTQLQSILQEQVKRFGDNIFQDGSVIAGCAESYNFAFPYVKILDLPSGEVTEWTTTALNALVGVELQGATSGVRGIVRYVETGTEIDGVNLKTLFIQYTQGGGTTGGNATFQSGEILNYVSGSGSLPVVASVTNSVGVGSLFTIDDGIVYASGLFVLHNKQTIILSKYSSTPSVKVGYTLTESVATYTDDATLVDPAQGSFNYTAPGADRYQVVTALTSYPLTTATPKDFFTLIEVDEGAIRRKYNRTQYAEIRNEMARRTYDESGNYAVRPFGVLIREHLKTNLNGGKYSGGDATKLAIGVESGKAYVEGYEYETLATEYLATDKGTDTRTVASRPVSTYYGAYVKIIEVAGPWNLNQGSLVSLTSTAPTAVTSGTYSTTAAPSGGQIVGSARVRSILYDSGTIGAAASVYRLYLYDISLNAGKSFSDVNGVYANIGSVAAFGKLSPAGTLYEGSSGATLFPLPFDAVKTLKPSGSYNATFQYKKQIDAALSSGTYSFTTDATENFAFSYTVGSNIPASLLQDNLMVVAKQDIGVSIKKGQVLNLDGTNGTAQFTSASTLSITITGGSTEAVSVVVNMDRIATGAKSKSLLTGRYTKIDTSTHSNGAGGPWTLGVADVVGIEKIWWVDGGTVDSATFAALAAEPTGSPWVDVTAEFTFTSGQKDGLYGLGTLRKNPGSTFDLSGGRILVRFKYYTHSTSGNNVAFFTVDSYPVNDASPSSSEIYTFQIPKYTTTQGATFDLRNTIDFRPRVVDTGVTSSVSAASVNPSSTETFTTGTVYEPVPTEELISDLAYYLPRIDRVVLNEAGDFSIIRGVSREKPIAPAETPTSMTIGILNITPYPSLAPNWAKTVGRPDLGCSLSLSDNRRYTMKDIGALAKRIDRVEYYTSLSLLEQKTASMLIESASTPGLNRFKNGFLVDNFSGHNVGNVFDTEYRCSIDPVKRTLRPYFTINSTDLRVSALTNMVQNAADAIVTVALAVGDVGDVVTSTSGASATGIITARAGTKLYLEQVTGSFSNGQNVNVGAVATTVSGTPILPAAGSLVTLPYTHKKFASNPFASKSRACVSTQLFDFIGDMILSPEQDLWTDTDRSPDVIRNADSQMDNWQHLAEPWGSSWESWIRHWAGYEVKTETDSPRYAPSAISPDSLNSVTPGSVTDVPNFSRFYDPTNPPVLPAITSPSDGTPGGFDPGSSVPTDLGGLYVDTSVVPYMRSAIVKFTASRLKPKTRVYPFFDGEDVSTYCRPLTDSSGITIGTPKFGDPIVTDGTGAIVGEFRIPAGTFRAGTKPFVLIDSSTYSGATSGAVAAYTASGVTTTISPTLVTTGNTVDLLSLLNLAGGRGQDPIAQSFFVSGKDAGMFVTKVDLFFRKVSASKPITLQIREVENGIPTTRVVPFGSVTLDPASVNADETAGTPTPFVFSSPVYLRNDTEYCWVLIPAGNTDEYEVWVSELGATQIGTTTRITQQPASGVLFVSANNATWTEIPSEDMKFNVWGASFNTGVTGTAVLANEKRDFIKVTMTSSTALGDFVPGETIYTGTAGQQAKVVYATRIDGTLYLQIEKINLSDTLFTGGESITSVTSTSGGSVTKTGTVVARVSFNYDSVTPTISTLEIPNTSLGWTATPYTTLGSAGTTFNVQINKTNETPVEYAVFSDSQYSGTLVFTGSATSISADVSPVIDSSKIGSILTLNQINNDSTGEDTPESGNALSRYITRSVALADGMDAEDLRVFLTQSTPGGTTIQVYAKLQNASDPTAFNELAWVKLTANGSSFEDFAEVSYSLPSSVLTSGVYTYNGYSGFKTFAIKIVLLSTSSAIVPEVQDMRAIALMI